MNTALRALFILSGFVFAFAFTPAQAETEQVTDNAPAPTLDGPSTAAKAARANLENKKVPKLTPKNMTHSKKKGRDWKPAPISNN